MVWLLNSNSLIDPGILAMKGEYCFPNLDFDIAKMTFDLRCIRRACFTSIIWINFIILEIVRMTSRPWTEEKEIRVGWRNKET